MPFKPLLKSSPSLSPLPLPILLATYSYTKERTKLCAACFCPNGCVSVFPEWFLLFSITQQPLGSSRADKIILLLYFFSILPWASKQREVHPFASSANLTGCCYSLVPFDLSPQRCSWSRTPFKALPLCKKLEPVIPWTLQRPYWSL